MNPMTARRWLNLINALLLGGVLGWFVRSHATMDHYLAAKALRYEAEASYYINKLDREIRETKDPLGPKGATK